jgi:DNA-binding MarR family transcriptional regulator
VSQPKEGYGLWVPGAVLSRTDISLEEKCLYGLLEVLDTGDGCWASNDWLGSRLGVSERAIQRYLARLEEVGLVVKVINEAAGNQRRVQTVGVKAVVTPSRQSVVTLTPSCRDPHANLSSKSRSENKNETDTEPLPLVLPHGETFKRAWGEWVNYRTKTKKRLSRFAQEKQLGLLQGLTEQEAVECINRSIANDWQGLFPEKKPKYGSKPFSKILTKEDHDHGF